jgi:Ca2+-binding RTX toxin-like protein
MATVSGTAGNDSLAGASEDDSIAGLAGADTLLGAAGNDTLDGGAGTDQLRGGTGDDTYVLDVAADAVVELANEGVDTVRLGFTAAVSYTIGVNVENAVVTSAAAINVTGNALANRMYGAGGNNSMAGGAGNDTLWAGAGGNDTLDGGSNPTGTPADQDVAYIDGSLSGYRVTRAGTTFTDLVFTRMSDGATQTLRNIEWVDFVTWSAGEAVVSQHVRVADLLLSMPSAGNDTLAGADGNDSLDGLAGNDLISGGAGFDTLQGGAGNDTLVGGADADILDGVLGNDTYRFDRSGGQDLIDQNDTVSSSIDTLEITDDTTRAELSVSRGFYAFDDLVVTIRRGDSVGQVVVADFFRDDAINNAGAIDQLRLTLGTSVATDDVLLTKAQLAALALIGDDGSNTLLGYAATADNMSGAGGDDWLMGAAGNDTLSGGAGSDFMYGGVGHDSLKGDEGADFISGADGNDTFWGGAGDDTLTGGAGSDIYMFELGGGHDLISDTWVIPPDPRNTPYYYDGVGDIPRSKDVDELRFAAGIARSDVIWQRVNNDLVVSLVGRSENVSIVNFFVSAIVPIETFRFADGSTMSAATIKAKVTQGTPGDDNITGYQASDSLSGFAGNDTISGAAGNDTISGGAGDDVLKGGTGNDLYRVAAGDGYDVIDDESGTDKIVLGTGFVSAQLLSYHRVNGTGLLVEYDGNPLLAIANHFAGRAVEVLQIGGTVIDLANVQPAGDLLFGTPSDDNIVGTYASDSIAGLGGADNLVASGGIDTLDGGAGNDTLRLNDAAVVVMSAGTDTVHARDSTDANYIVGSNATGTTTIRLSWTTYPPARANQTFELQDGVTIASHRWIVTGGTSILELGLSTGGWLRIDPSSEFFARDDFLVMRGGEAPVSLASILGSEVITGTASDDQLFALAGSTLEGGAGADQLNGGAGDDSLSGGADPDDIRGGDGSDTLDGGSGADFMAGGIGADVYVLRAGHGADQIYEYAGQGVDSIRFEGVNADDATFSISSDGGYFLEVRTAGGDVANVYLGPSGVGNLQVEKFVFDDVTLSVADVRDRTPMGGNGPDTLIGTDANELLDGRGGDDLMSGNWGNDTLVASGGSDTLIGGYGNDEFRIVAAGASVHFGDEPYQESGTDTLAIGSASIVSASWSAGLLTLTLDSGAAVTGTATQFGLIEGVRRDGEEARPLNSLFASDTVVGGDGNDTLAFVVSAGGELHGGAGDDRLQGGAQADLLDGGSGDNTLTGYDGVDVYRFGAESTGHSVVDDGSPDGNVLEFVDGVSIHAVSGDSDGLHLQLSNGGAVDLYGAEWTYREEAGELHALSELAPSRVINGTVGNDNLVASGFARFEIHAGQGNDTVGGQAFDDTLDGGAGIDRLSGGGGTNVYIFNAGWGQDTVYDNGKGVISFGDGISVSQIHFERSGYDLVISRSASADAIQVAEQFISGSIASFQFADGTVLSAADVLNIVLAPSDGPDQLTGTGANDLIDGLAGSDSIMGEDGDDTLVGGEGDDTLRGGLGSDSLLGGEGRDYIYGSDYYVPVPEHNFLDGGAGDDYIWTYGANDVVSDGSGQDIIWVDRAPYFSTGDLTIHLVSDGDWDRIYADNTVPTIDTIAFDDVTFDKLWFVRSGNSLVVRTLGTWDGVAIEDWFSSFSARVDVFHAGGRALYQSDVNALISAMEGIDPDTVTSTSTLGIAAYVDSLWITV